MESLEAFGLYGLVKALTRIVRSAISNLLLRFALAIFKLISFFLSTKIALKFKAKFDLSDRVLALLREKITLKQMSELTNLQSLQLIELTSLSEVDSIRVRIALIWKSCLTNSFVSHLHRTL